MTVLKTNLAVALYEEQDALINVVDNETLIAANAIDINIILSFLSTSFNPYSYHGDWRDWIHDLPFTISVDEEWKLDSKGIGPWAFDKSSTWKADKDVGPWAFNKGSWITENKGAGPWAFEKQQPKYGYRNNPRWVDLTDAARVETLSPVWPMTEGQMSAGASDKHEPCGYWFGEPGGGGGGGVGCVGCKQIGYTSQQMSLNEQQTFTCLDVNGVLIPDVSDGTWTVVSGGGTITQGGVYTAPATNPNCDKNPTIGLLCRGVLCDTVQIAINLSTSGAPAVLIKTAYLGSLSVPQGTPGCSMPTASGCVQCYAVGGVYKNCNGGPNYSIGSCGSAGGGIGNWGPEGTGQFWMTHNPEDCFDYICKDLSSADGQSVAGADAHACGYIGQFGNIDVRTEAMIAAGCCPWQLL